MNEAQSPDPNATSQQPQAPFAAPPTPPPAPWADSQRQPFDPRQKSPRMAALLSMVPGLGQVYIGYYSRGFMLVSSMLMLGAFANAAPRLEPIPQFGMMFIWLFNIIDAGRMAAMYNHAIAGKQSIDLPDNFKMPAMGGSVVGGGILVGFGLLALSSTLFGLSLEWIEDWWPMFPIAVGAYLLYRGIQERG